MKNILHKMIDTVGDILRLYINAKYIKTPGSRAITCGLAILVLLLGNNVVGILKINIPHIEFAASVNASGIPAYWELILYCLSLFLILLGMAWIFYIDWKQRKHEAEENDRKVVLVVQIDAYSNVIQSPLALAVPAEIKGRRTPIMIEKRDALLGGNSLKETAEDVLNIERTLNQYASSHNLADINVCAGGFAPVPFLFLLGNVLEDERPTHWAEWDRNESRWAWSKNGIYVQPWSTPSLDSTPADEVVLKSGITYSIADKDVACAFPKLSVVKWEPTDKLFQVILDEQSCRDICDQFKTLMCQLKGQGVKRIHFLLACSTALTMRLGSVLDPRNMPEIIVYQYEKNSDLIYTWGLGVKVHEGRKSTIVIDHRKIIA